MNISYRLFAAFAFALLLSPSLIFAENYVAINSHDGRDVLSGIFYANVKGYPVAFLPSTGGGNSSMVFARKVGENKSVLLIQSATNPMSGFVESELASGRNTVELFPSENGARTNLELARRSGASHFIIVDSAFSDSAVAAIPYAALKRAYVILADNENAAEVKGIVAGKQVTVYGYIDSTVKSAIAQESPSYIGTGEDKYEDSVTLAKLIMAQYNTTRPTITDGSMLEDSIAIGNSPILLSGRLVPQVTYDFVKQKAGEGKITGVYLIGNEMISPVYDMRERIKNEYKAEGRDVNFGIMVKFAQGTTDLGVMGLDLFRVPAYKPALEVTEIVYNRQTGKVMVGLENIGEGPLYFSLELKVRLNGEDYRVFGEKGVLLIERGESMGLQYDLDLSNVTSGDLVAALLVKFGSTKKSLDEYLTATQPLESIAYVDDSNVTVKFAKYDPVKKMLRITIKNNGEKVAYAFTKATLIDENGVPTKISAAAIRELEPLSIYVEEIPLELSPKELELNKDITVSVDYGGRRGFLLKKAIYTLPLEQETLAPGGIELQGIIVGLLLALLLFAVLYAIYWLLIGRKKKKKKEGEEGEAGESSADRN